MKIDVNVDAMEAMEAMEVKVMIEAKLRHYECLIKESGLRLHHSALHRGYVRVGKVELEPYQGRFGKGWVARLHAMDTTRYHVAEYWVE